MRPRHNRATPPPEVTGGAERTIELREEQLVAKKERHELGEVLIHTETEEVPARLEVEATHDEVVVEHEAVGQAVSEREPPWEHDGELIVPVYEEQLVVTKRLVLRERLHVRRVSAREQQLFQDTVRRDRLVVEDPQGTGAVREMHPTGDAAADDESEEQEKSGILTRLVSKALE